MVKRRHEEIVLQEGGRRQNAAIEAVLARLPDGRYPRPRPARDMTTVFDHLNRSRVDAAREALMELYEGKSPSYKNGQFSLAKTLYAWITPLNDRFVEAWDEFASLPENQALAGFDKVNDALTSDDRSVLLNGWNGLQKRSEMSNGVHDDITDFVRGMKAGRAAPWPVLDRFRYGEEGIRAAACVEGRGPRTQRSGPGGQQRRRLELGRRRTSCVRYVMHHALENADGLVLYCAVLIAFGRQTIRRAPR
jgi:hypothetical protein